MSTLDERAEAHIRKAWAGRSGVFWPDVFATFAEAETADLRTALAASLAREEALRVALVGEPEHKGEGRCPAR